MKYKVVRYVSTWEVYNNETKRVVVEGPLPYMPSREVSDFFIAVQYCTLDTEVMGMYSALYPDLSKSKKVHLRLDVCE
jgi:hypothetical protein